MPARTTSAVRREEIEQPVSVAGPVTAGWPGAQTALAVTPAGSTKLPLPVAVPKSRCRYSARIDQLRSMAYSSPPPATQPSLVSDSDELNVAEFSTPEDCATVSLVTARPPVA